MRDRYSLAVPARSRFARGRGLKIADLEEASWCTPPLGSWATALVQDLCRRFGGFEPRIDYPTDDVAMAQPLVAAGLAVALLPALNLIQPHPGVAVRELSEAPLAREIWCVQPSGRRLPAAAAMVDEVSLAARSAGV